MEKSKVKCDCGMRERCATVHIKTCALIKTQQLTPKVKLRVRQFNPHAVEVDELCQLLRLPNLQRLQNKLRIAHDENPALYYGMVKLIWSAIPSEVKGKHRASWK